MTQPVRFHPLASAEVVDAQLWFERRSVGLGDRFIRALVATTDRAARWPNAGAPVRTLDDGSVAERQVAMSGFPYAIVYRVAGDVVEVLAVHHQHRRPEYWASRAH